MPTRAKGFTIIEIMIVVAIIGILVAIAFPAFFNARNLTRARTCQQNLQKIDGAKQSWAIETTQPPGAEPDWETLVGNEEYIRNLPVCPAGGEYTIGTVSEEPTCSVGTSNPRYPHVLDARPPGFMNPDDD